MRYIDAACWLHIFLYLFVGLPNRIEQVLCILIGGVLRLLTVLPILLSDSLGPGRTDRIEFCELLSKNLVC